MVAVVHDLDDGAGRPRELAQQFLTGTVQYQGPKRKVYTSDVITLDKLPGSKESNFSNPAV